MNKEKLLDLIKDLTASVQRSVLVANNLKRGKESKAIDDEISALGNLCRFCGVERLTTEEVSKALNF